MSVSILFHPLSSSVMAGVDCAITGFATIGRANDISKIARNIVANAFFPIFKLFRQDKLRKRGF